MTYELTLLLFFVFIVGLCWGSFLNMLAYRLSFEKPLFTMRSCCPQCGKVIAWYDNIPVVSWIALGGKCRACKQSITKYYLFFELVTAVVMVFIVVNFLPRFFPMYYFISGDPLSLDMLQFTDGVPNNLLAHAIGSLMTAVVFFSALIAASHADMRAMIIPQQFSIWLAPVGVVLSYFNLICHPGLATGSIFSIHGHYLSWHMSLLGAALGYGILWIVATVFKWLTKKDGLGVGDMELLCMIGAFSGPFGVWFTLMIGSITGMVIGGIYLVLSGHGRMTRIPFGPFLALGAAGYFFCGQQLLALLAR
jgi:leader peptidase (prepilin peptidase)/N-methyltransferase